MRIGNLTERKSGTERSVRFDEITANVSDTVFDQAESCPERAPSQSGNADEERSDERNNGETETPECIPPRLINPICGASGQMTIPRAKRRIVSDGSGIAVGNRFFRQKEF